MFRVPENNASQFSLLDEEYDFQRNGSYNDSIDFYQVMGFTEMCHPFSKYLHTLHMFYTPTIVVVGFVGNVLSFLVLSTTHLNMRSSSYYLAALAVSLSRYT